MTADGRRIAALLANALAGLPVEVAFIFGSFAAGTETPLSDVDLFIVTEAEGDTSARLFDAQLDVLREINSITMTSEKFRARISSPSAFLMNVMRVDKVFLSGDEDVLRRLEEDLDRKSSGEASNGAV